jgi:(E)-4-hydroxy-3-methylbut-2-enyl-diphosphate synthase
MSYCTSRVSTVRRPTLEVNVGGIGIGGHHPIRVQSMTTSDTQDVDATVKQSIALAEVGCEIVRITAPNLAAARALKEIRARLTAAGFGHIPLVADIHFLPNAAMEAVEHVEKVRVNPGNYADKKKFAVREYSDDDYERELQRLHDAFSPLVKRCRELGRAMRIGTNHGSLSDRIMNRYGDTPLGMVESALEFLRIAEAHSYRQIILSMKASNPKVMIQAYRLLVHRMAQENMHYPLHLGVTEAGDGEDGRIKSAIGIGSLLFDGLGDTIRVSLTEDSVYEIPVAQALARKAISLWRGDAAGGPLSDSVDTIVAPAENVDPYHFARREVVSVTLGDACAVGPEQPPRVIVRCPAPAALPEFARQLRGARLVDTPVEGVLVPVEHVEDLPALVAARAEGAPWRFLALDLGPRLAPADLEPFLLAAPAPVLLVREFAAEGTAELRAWADLANRGQRHLLVVAATPTALAALGDTLSEIDDQRLLVTLADRPWGEGHAMGAYRRLAAALAHAGCRAPLWIRNTSRTAVEPAPTFLSRLLDASILSGSLLCDGLGDLVSIETEPDAPRAVSLAYNVLQGAGARISKTEFVACPSCGRTLFDLQSTTQRIRAQTGHLKGVKIAIMGCIVNGPGEMADADFGYVGGAPGKINLYVGKTCVQYNIPQAEADDRLIALIRAHGKWVDAPTPAAATAGGS